MEMVGQSQGGKTGSSVDSTGHPVPVSRNYWSRYIILLLNTVIFTHSVCIFLSYGRMVPDLIKDYPQDIVMVTFAGALGIGIQFSIGYPTLLLYKKIGICATLCLGVVLSSAGFLSLAFITKAYTIVLGYGLLAGTGTGVVLFSIIYLTAELFPYNDPQHVMALGVVYVGNNIGLSLAGPYTDILIMQGWVFMIVCFVVVNTILAVIVIPVTYILLRRHKATLAETDTRITDSETVEEEVSLLMHGESNSFSKLRSISSLLLLSITMFFGFPPMLVPYLLVIEHAKLLGINTRDGSLLQLVYGIVGLVVQLTTVLIGDKFMKGRARYIYCIMLAISILFNILGASWTEYWLLMVYITVCGILHGQWMVLMLPLSSEILEGNYSKELLSICSTMMGAGDVVSMVFGGFIQKKTGSLKGTFYANAGISVVALISAVLLCGLISRKWK